MPLFTLERDMDVPEDDPGLENSMFRVISSAVWWQVRWMRSYARVPSDRILGFCVYDSPAPVNLASQAVSCRVPYVALAEVEELLAPGEGLGADSLAEGHSLFLVERTFAGGWSAAGLREANVCASMTEGVSWLRSYWDAEGHRARCIFGATSRAALQAAVQARSSPSELAISAAQLNHPSNWERMYDTFELPHHWEEESRPDLASAVATT
ncbi:MAG TPA: DUF4242 domain-containing protein [Tepidiformaceae bacterium]|nr:DUF4242 domain-containing protein [Tepidiformaceae bacterium]HMO96504.1 DUF4242 domain-containing protein [Tepidiformaceae bacterium]